MHWHMRAELMSSSIGSVEELDELIEALNPRGIRESELKERLNNEHEFIVKNLRKFNANVERQLKIEQVKKI